MIAPDCLAASDGDLEVSNHPVIHPRSAQHPSESHRPVKVLPAASLLAFNLALTGVTSESFAITLAEAAALPVGTQVTIDQALVINSTRMTLAGTDLIQLRDDTRAVSFFAGSDGLALDDFLPGIYTGDVISFTATTHNFKGLFELTTPLTPANIVPNPTINTGLDPVPVNPLDFADLSPTAEGLESRYVEIQNIELFSTLGVSVAGELFQFHTKYRAIDGDGNETEVWGRSQESVNSLNAHFGTIPAGPFNLPGIFLHAFDPGDPLPGVTGTNYILNPVFATLPGDLNADGFVGIDDLNIILPAWNLAVTPGNHQQGDPSGDGFVGIDDLTIVLGNWNAGSPPHAEASVLIPEPGIYAVALTLSGFVLCQRSSLHQRT